jgi:hypothetical protein
LRIAAVRRTIWADHIERELGHALYDWNVNGDDSYFKELDKRYEAGFLQHISLWQQTTEALPTQRRKTR